MIPFLVGLIIGAVLGLAIAYADSRGARNKLLAELADEAIRRKAAEATLAEIRRKRSQAGVKAGKTRKARASHSEIPNNSTDAQLAAYVQRTTNAVFGVGHLGRRDSEGTA